MEDPQSQANHLQILTSGSSRDVPWLRAYIVDDALLQPWNQEMCPLVDNRILYSGQSVEDDSSSASLHIVHGSLDSGGSDRQRNGRPVYAV